MTNLSKSWKDLCGRLGVQPKQFATLLAVMVWPWVDLASRWWRAVLARLPPHRPRERNLRRRRRHPLLRRRRRAW
jgi:hypothetical protein